jgi:hypothetical protein
MSKAPWIYFLSALLFLGSCSALKESIKPEVPDLIGIKGLEAKCLGSDTVQSLLIKKAEAILSYDKERYEVNLTLYSKKDSIIYLSAVSNGFEILRASVDHDSIKVIDRMNKIVYRSPLQRRFGYQYPVNFRDLQNLIDGAYLCNYMELGRDDQVNNIVFEFDERNIKKRILLDRRLLDLRIFEFYHQITDRYIMGERQEGALKIYSNFMITDIELVASGGERSFNGDIKIKMDVNPRKYTFTELR